MHIINDNVIKILVSKILQGTPTTLINDISSTQMNIDSHLIELNSSKPIIPNKGSFCNNEAIKRYAQ